MLYPSQNTILHPDYYTLLLLLHRWLIWTEYNRLNIMIIIGILPYMQYYFNVFPIQLLLSLSSFILILIFGKVVLLSV